jgi:uncharacterized membrane protein
MLMLTVERLLRRVLSIALGLFIVGFPVLAGAANVTDKIIELATAARGGKIASGSWTPPPAPPATSLFGR